MIHPSYVEMIEKINKDQDREEAPLVTSRYSIVLASAKRARQIIDGDKPRVNSKDKNGTERKPLSIAVDELYDGEVNILPREDNGEE
ncbi:MAG: DNA-directed RNA polymerase subunit omega [Eubacterium sp.]|jgi:DNA-directed RNA polymerase subunit omega|uniref:DNA-directed RNA polymerase subunit omega n=1 Tax=Eubacterium cellulosolvens (strain ATCC 43171 / JCM 9499 / 6) TaxID=633697 RepID=I5AQQ6_EUBC6|nr:DNA-directed RNA polymerase subunit omega [Eubacterium sp.]